MNRIEQRETEERVKKAWDDGFSFGMWIGAVVGALLVGAAVGMLAGVAIF